MPRIFDFAVSSCLRPIVTSPILSRTLHRIIPAAVQIIKNVKAEHAANGSLNCNYSLFMKNFPSSLNLPCFLYDTIRAFAVYSTNS